MQAKGTERVAETTCVDLFENITEFIRSELPDPQMATLNSHIQLCQRCARVVEDERRFEKDISSAIDMEVFEDEPSLQTLERLNKVIMDKISATPNEPELPIGDNNIKTYKTPKRLHKNN